MYYYKSALNKAKKYALKKFVKSEYLKETTSILPLTILSIITRSIFNFLITYRLKTNIYILDMFFSIFITIFFSLSAPFFYNLFNTLLKNEMNDFSRHVIDSFWKDGWKYFDYWKNRILGSLGLFCIFLLFFIEVNSTMIQEFIFHTLISSSIVDYINNRHKKEPQEQTARLISRSNVLESYYPQLKGGEGNKILYKEDKILYKKEDKILYKKEDKILYKGEVKARSKEEVKAENKEEVKAENKEEVKAENKEEVKAENKDKEIKIFKRVKQSSSDENDDPVTFSIINDYKN